MSSKGGHVRWLWIAAVPVLAVLSFSSRGADNDSRRALPDMPAQAAAEQRIKELVAGGAAGTKPPARAARAHPMMAQPGARESDRGAIYAPLPADRNRA